MVVVVEDGDAGLLVDMVVDGAPQPRRCAGAGASLSDRPGTAVLLERWAIIVGVGGWVL